MKFPVLWRKRHKRWKVRARAAWAAIGVSLVGLLSNAEVGPFISQNLSQRNGFLRQDRPVWFSEQLPCRSRMVCLSKKGWPLAWWAEGELVGYTDADSWIPEQTDVLERLFSFFNVLFEEKSIRLETGGFTGENGISELSGPIAATANLVLPFKNILHRMREIPFGFEIDADGRGMSGVLESYFYSDLAAIFVEHKVPDRGKLQGNPWSLGRINLTFHDTELALSDCALIFGILREQTGEDSHDCSSQRSSQPVMFVEPENSSTNWFSKVAKKATAAAIAALGLVILLWGFGWGLLSRSGYGLIIAIIAGIAGLLVAVHGLGLLIS